MTRRGKLTPPFSGEYPAVWERHGSRWRRPRQRARRRAGLALEHLEQRLGLLEVGRVKALCKPAVDRGQQLVGLGALALLLPEATESLFEKY